MDPPGVLVALCGTPGFQQEQTFGRTFTLGRNARLPRNNQVDDSGVDIPLGLAWFRGIHPANRSTLAKGTLEPRPGASFLQPQLAHPIHEEALLPIGEKGGPLILPEPPHTRRSSEFSSQRTLGLKATVQDAGVVLQLLLPIVRLNELCLAQNETDSSGVSLERG